MMFLNVKKNVILIKDTVTKMEKEIIISGIKEVAKQYTESKATTNAGFWGRLLAKVLTSDFIIKLVAHKLSK
jgi:hypothetical protein